MFRILRRDIYKLHVSGFPIDKVESPVPNPLVATQYCYLYWIDHLLDCNKENTINDLKNGGSIYDFLSTIYFYWLETLSLMKSLPDDITDVSPNLYAFIHNAKRFAIYNRSVIEQAPLQSYCSALIFAPEKIQAHWSAALQTLEGHSSPVRSVAFSPDGKQVVSGSGDGTVRLWDTTTGAVLQTL
ncbi:hypothetical protein BDZ45DRAFT_591086 [Acephala macrosclerotiorum]|nr:hypothetical protein BDZ45DRAFT_591086 [Acephala macrosclerotiorum]